MRTPTFLAAVAAAVALALVPAAADAAKPKPKPAHARPHVKPKQLRGSADAATVVLGGPNYLIGEYHGCTNWQRVGSRWLYSCSTTWFFGGEAQSTDYVHYYWTGSRAAYYGTYTCIAHGGACRWV
jgi:hypothetical protein